MAARISCCLDSIAPSPSRPWLLTPSKAVTCRRSSSRKVSRCLASRPVKVSNGNRPLIQHLLVLLLPNGIFALPFGLGSPVTVRIIINYPLVLIQGRLEVVRQLVDVRHLVMDPGGFLMVGIFGGELAVLAHGALPILFLEGHVRQTQLGLGAKVA